MNNQSSKTICAALFAGVIAFSVFGANTSKTHLSEAERKARAEAFQKLPRAEKDRIIAERKAAIDIRAGGRLRNTAKQSGRILVANMQSAANENVLREAMRKLAAYLKIEIVVESLPKVEAPQFKALMKEKKANALICIGESDSYGSLTVAPDDAWAYVNVKALGTTNLDDRTKKELVRAFVFLCGGASSQYPNPLTRPVSDVRTLDLIDRVDIPIDILGRMPPYLEAMGVTPYVEATYRTACREGWAPQPTNEIQRAIWEQVHELPSNPLPLVKPTK